MLYSRLYNDVGECLFFLLTILHKPILINFIQMKNNLLLLAAFMFAFTFANAQYKVLLVDDDVNSYDEWEYVSTALTNSGYAFDTINIDTNASPDFNTLNAYDMVIWHTANDGLDLNLWDTVTGNPVQYNAAIMQFLDSNGVLWVDGLDFMFDQFGAAPVDFAAGDFVYDRLGISKYAAQSHANDTVGSYSGLTVVYAPTTNTITTQDSLKWKWSSVWYADAFEITNEATSLFEMGPSDYDFYGKVSGLYKENIITTSLRIASLGDGSARVQADIDLLVKEMIVAAEAGTFVKNTSSISTSTKEDNVTSYPNPVSDVLTITFDAARNASIKVYDLGGKVIMEDVISENATQYQINVTDINSGVYFFRILSNNSIVSKKFTVIK